VKRLIFGVKALLWALAICFGITERKALVGTASASSSDVFLDASINLRLLLLSKTASLSLFYNGSLYCNESY
jgi:hypothetical protein